MTERTKVWQKFARWGVINVTRSESGDFHTVEVHRPIATPSRYAAIGEAQRMADHMDDVFDKTGRFFFTPVIPREPDAYERLRRGVQKEKFQEYLDYWEGLAASEKNLDLPASSFARLAADHIRSMMEAMED